MLFTRSPFGRIFLRFGSVACVVCVALVPLSACDGGGGMDDGGGQEEQGDPPTVAEGIDDARLTPGGEVVEFDLGTVFAVPDGSEVTFSASSTDPAVAETSVQDAVLTVTSGDSGGEATVTVTAENDAGTAEDVFLVEVFADPPGRP